MNQREAPTIPGADEVAATLGRWPSFHDAEILAVHVVRGGESTVSVELVAPDKRGPVIRFSFRTIAELDLVGEDADSQNAISELSIDDTPQGVKVTFWPCYGLSGHIIAAHVRVWIQETT